jgi:hypothetical protein
LTFFFISAARFAAAASFYSCLRLAAIYSGDRLNFGDDIIFDSSN